VEGAEAGTEFLAPPPPSFAWSPSPYASLRWRSRRLPTAYSPFTIHYSPLARMAVDFWIKTAKTSCEPADELVTTDEFDEFLTLPGTSC
jgi:hypothetical protein